MSAGQSHDSGDGEDELAGRRGSRHFRPEEFACPHCGAIAVHPELLRVLERIRARAGDKPIAIRSGYRCPTHNRAVGGAPHSQHLLGKAADLYPGVIRPAQAQDCGASGIGVAGEWAVHVDVRDGPVTKWYY